MRPVLDCSLTLRATPRNPPPAKPHRAFLDYESTGKKFPSVRTLHLGVEEQSRPGPGLIALRRRLSFARFLPLSLLLLLIDGPLFGQAQTPSPAVPLPNAPLPVVKHPKTGPCRVIPKTESAGKTLTATGAGFLATAAGMPPVPVQSPQPSSAPGITPQELPPCPLPPLINFYNRFMNGPEVKPLTPREKAHLAARNLLDPFNAVTILGNAAIAVGSNSHSAYGPGMTGFGRYVGVSYSEDLTGEFFGTFLIPSVFHQDPHYHREPHSTIRHRILHAIAQVAWTQGDNGKGMPNYSDLLGFPIDAEIANLYVPGEKTNLPSTAARVVTGWALAPTDNFVTEFLPDVASHIHIRIVFVQQIINQVARTEPAGTP